MHSYLGKHAAPMAVAALLLCISGLRAQTPYDPIEDVRIDPGKFAIFPWDFIPPDKAAYDELHECGFNMAGFVTTSSLSIVDESSLKCWVSDPAIHVRGGEKLADEEIASRVKAVVAASQTHPSVLGYHVVDEPTRPMLPNVARWVKAFHAEAPRKIAYVNLNPDYSQHETGVTTDAYHGYMQAFIDQVKPDVISYDHYALFENGTMRDAYFPNLETGREMSLKSGLPFFHVILGNAHFEYAEPSPEWFRFQVYTSLAYGVRGIAWFTYRGRERGNYRETAVDLYGQRSPTWKMMRDVNLVCHRLAPALVSMKSMGVFHHPDQPKGCLGLADSKFVKELKGRGPFVVGEFQDNSGTPAILVVNKSLTQSTRFQIVPRDIAAGTTIRKVSSSSGKLLPMAAENDWLAPGQGMLLRLEKK